MPVDRKDIEITKEVPSLLRKMERGKFYTVEELFRLEYGMEFDEQLPDTETQVWGWWWILNAFLELLVVQEKLITGTRRDEPPRAIKLHKDGKVKNFPLPRKVYYGLPG